MKFLSDPHNVPVKADLWVDIPGLLKNFLRSHHYLDDTGLIPTVTLLYAPASIIFKNPLLCFS